MTKPINLKNKFNLLALNPRDKNIAISGTSYWYNNVYKKIINIAGDFKFEIRRIEFFNDTV